MVKVVGKYIPNIKPMRLFLINWGGKELGMIQAARELQKKHSIVYWTCMDIAREVDARDFPDTLLHEHMDALHGISHPTPPFMVPPADPKLLEALATTEIMVLTMMSKHFENIGVNERRHLYKTYVAYWYAALSDLRPDAVVFPTIPHTVYDFVIYSLCKLKDIVTVMFETTWIGDRILLLTDYKKGPEYLFSAPRQGAAGAELSEDIRREYELHTNGVRDATPVFVKGIIRRYSGVRLVLKKFESFWSSARRDPLSLFRVFASFARRMRGNLRREYERVQSNPELGRPYVYLPLHYQPEKNSAPLGGEFVDQLYLTRILSAALPEGWMMYVKEHPTQWLPRGVGYFSYRFRGYYEQLARLSNVKVVPMETNTYVLTRHSRAVATITGTSGFEAILCGKPALVFGYPWYKGAPGLFEVRDLASCREALRSISSSFSFSESEVLDFLRRLDRGSFHGYIDRDGKAVSSLSPEENALSLKSHIEKALLLCHSQ